MTTLPDEALDGPWKLPGLTCTGCGQTMGVRMLLQGPRCCLCETRDLAAANPVPLPESPEALRDLASAGYVPAAQKLERTGWPPGLLQDDRAALAAQPAAEARPVRNREADRERFTDPEFNRWLDEGISDAGHTVWDAVGDVQAAWQGWNNRQFYAAPPARPVAPAGWIACDERMPDSGVTVLACYQNQNGKWRRIRASWVAAKTQPSDSESDFGEYDEASDCYYDPEGWYEQIDNWPEYTACTVDEGRVTHWMPLPPPPGASPAAPAAPVEMDPSNTLEWLGSHCRAIGMTRKSDSGLLAHDIALFTIDLQDAARTAAASAAVAQGAWLVEWRFNGVQWLYLWPRAAGGFSFTGDANRALRFARREDAEAALQWARATDAKRGASRATGEMLVTQHEWPCAAPAPVALTEEQIMSAARVAGFNLDPTPNMLYTVRGNTAQVLNLARAIERAHGISAPSAPSAEG